MLFENSFLNSYLNLMLRGPLFFCHAHLCILEVPENYRITTVTYLLIGTPLTQGFGGCGLRTLRGPQVNYHVLYISIDFDSFLISRYYESLNDSSLNFFEY